jgi:predicted DNA-binding transcriptional regulator AlpA
MFDRSVKTIDRWNVEGRLPAPMPIGQRSLYWDREELRRWQSAGSPPRDEWERIKRAQK